MLHSLHASAGRLDIDLVVGHVDHGLRDAATEDSLFVQKIASALGLQAYVSAVDVSGLVEREHLSVEEAARVLRYRALIGIARDLGCTAIATAHTKDDSAETILMRLFRGSGGDGLRGILPNRTIAPGIALIRPLLSCSKDDVLDYCRNADLEYVDDETNSELRFMRNMIRTQIVPQLNSTVPGWQEGVIRSGKRIAEDSEFISRQVQPILDEVIIDSGYFRLDMNVLRTLEPTIASRVIRKGFFAVTKDREIPCELSSERVFALLNRLKRPGGFEIELGSGVTATAEHDVLSIHYVGSDSVPVVTEVESLSLSIPGMVSDHHEELALSITPRSDNYRADTLSLDKESFTATMDKDSLKYPITLRQARPGDRIKPLGMDGHKKISDLLIDRKVPRTLRPRILVLESDDRIAWVVGVEVSEDFKVDGNSTNSMLVEVNDSRFKQ